MGMENSNIYNNILQIDKKLSNYTRGLDENEISQLVSQNNFCQNWELIKVEPDFTTNNIKNSIFEGEVFLPRFTSENKLAGIFNCHIKNCVFESCLAHNVQLLENVFVGKNSILRACGDIRGTLSRPKILTMPIHPGSEMESRSLWFEENLTVESATKWLQISSNQQLEVKEKKISEIPNNNPKYMYIGPDVHICGVGEIVNCYIDEATQIQYASRVSNSVILGSTSNPCNIGNCQLIENSGLQAGCTVKNGAIVRNSIIMEASELDEQVIINQSLIGPNNHCAKGEITACLLGPFVGFHHQSLLISVLWPEGKGNVGHGAKVGSNHTGRKPDQELIPAEGMFFGLGCQVKFPGNYSKASYSLIATAVVLPPQKVECPFSLITQEENLLAGYSPLLNNIMPGWMWGTNAYSLFRSLFKFKERNKSSHNIPDSLFSQKIAEHVLNACMFLKNISEKKKYYTEEDIPEIGQNILSDAQRLKALDNYSNYIYFYLLQSSMESSIMEAFLSVAGLTSFYKITDPAQYLISGKNLLEELETKLLKSLARDNKRGREIFSDYDNFHLRENEFEEKDPVILKFKELKSRWENYLESL